MALHDFHCPACDAVVEDVYRTAAEGAWPLDCPACGARMEWIPKIGRMDVGGVKGAAFQKFNIHRQIPTREGLVQVEEQIDSVHKLRKVEKDSEQRYRDGEGEPLRFRGYNQDSSNKDQNAFGDSGSIGDRHYDSGQQPKKKANISVNRHGQQKPKIPVARGGGSTALK